jgi:hypothetical protein
MDTWADTMAAARRRQAADRQALYEDEQARKTEKFEARHVPMDQRIAALLRDLPDAERGQARHISFFTDSLKARWRGQRAHAGQVAEGLRRLGWTRTRSWNNKAGAFQARWRPPGE